MYDPPSQAPQPAGDIKAIMPTQYASALSLRKRRNRRDRRSQDSSSRPSSFLDRKKNRDDYRNILNSLKQTCKKLKLHENNLHISLLEIPDGFLLKAYDCSSNRQVCHQLSERFFQSPEKIEGLLKEIMSGTGLIIDLTI